MDITDDEDIGNRCRVKRAALFARWPSRVVWKEPLQMLEHEDPELPVMHKIGKPPVQYNNNVALHSNLLFSSAHHRQ